MIIKTRTIKLIMSGIVLSLAFQSCVKDSFDDDPNVIGEEEEIVPLAELEVPVDFAFNTTKTVTLRLNEVASGTRYNIYLPDNGSGNNELLSSAVASDNTLEQEMVVPSYVQELVVEEVGVFNSTFETLGISGGTAVLEPSGVTAKASLSGSAKNSLVCANGPDNDGDGDCDDIDTDDDNDGQSDDVETQKTNYFATLSDQSLTVPAGAVAMEFKMWGAGGGGASAFGRFAPGGAGGYVSGLVTVTPGEQFTLVVGEGGRTDNGHGVNTTSYGFGGNGNPSSEGAGADGGGLSGIFTGTATVLDTDVARAIAVAGGGGGGEIAGTSSGIGHATGGQGGDTQFAGGQSTMRGASSGIIGFGASGGGGGYLGGNAQVQRLSDDAEVYHGEGGTNFWGGRVLNAITAHSADLGVASQTTTSTVLPPFSGDADYVSGVGNSSSASASKAGDGMIVIRFYFDTDGDGIFNQFDTFDDGSDPNQGLTESFDFSNIFNTGAAFGPFGGDDSWFVEGVNVADAAFAPSVGGQDFAAITGNLAPGGWVDAPAGSDWISYPFNGANNGPGTHADADGDGVLNENPVNQSGATGDWVALNFSNTFVLNTDVTGFTLTFDMAADNFVTAIKVNGVLQSVVHTNAVNPLQRITLDSDWIQGPNTVEIEVHSSPDRAGLLVTNAVGTFLADTDDDQVVDKFDDFPNDPTRAYASYYPSADQWASVAFEDLWPFAGDYDFNDLVVEYRIRTARNTNNQIVGMDYVINEISVGGSFINGFGIRLEGMAPNSIASVTGQSLTEGFVSNVGNGTENGQTDAVVMLFDNALALNGQGLTVAINFAAPLSSLPAAPFDPFMVVNAERQMEVHLPGKTATALGNSTPTVEGNSNVDPDGDYQSTTGLPWALNISGSYDAPVEKVPVNEAYLFFNNWATSGGASNTDWYLDLAGHRNPAKIKQ